jgi:anti-anti-sigma factor
VSTIIQVDVERRDGIAVARLDGELDTATVGDVAIKLRRLVANDQLRLIVDLVAVTYLDSAGINLLYAVGGELRARQLALHLVVAPGSPIERMLTIVGAMTAFPVHPTLDDALAAS